MNIKKFMVGLIVVVLIGILIFQNKNISQTNIQQVKKEKQIEKQEVGNSLDSYKAMTSTTQEKDNQQHFYQDYKAMTSTTQEEDNQQHFSSLVFDTNGSDDLASLKSKDCKKIYNNNPKKLISPFLTNPQDLEDLWLKAPKVMTSIMSYLMCQYYIDKDNRYLAFASDLDINIAYLDFVNDIVNTKEVNPHKCNKWLSLAFAEEKGKGASPKICNMIKDAIISRSSDEICDNSPNPNRCNFSFLFLKGKKYCKNILTEDFPFENERRSKSEKIIIVNKMVFECETLSDLLYNNSNSWLANVLKYNNPIACESLSKDMIENVCSDSFLNTLRNMKIQKTKQRGSFTNDQLKKEKNNQVDEE